MDIGSHLAKQLLCSYTLQNSRSIALCWVRQCLIWDGAEMRHTYLDYYIKLFEQLPLHNLGILKNLRTVVSWHISCDMWIKDTVFAPSCTYCWSKFLGGYNFFLKNLVCLFQSPVILADKTHILFFVRLISSNWKKKVNISIAITTEELQSDFCFHEKLAVHDDLSDGSALLFLLGKETTTTLIIKL